MKSTSHANFEKFYIFITVQSESICAFRFVGLYWLPDFIMAQVMNICGLTPVEDPSYRYKMPGMSTKIEGRGNGIKTVLTNVVEVAASLNRDPQVMNFLQCVFVILYIKLSLGSYQIFWLRAWFTNHLLF